ncbi:hypothetical protein GCM10028777_19830 [Angustibacter speluncae]
MSEPVLLGLLATCVVGVLAWVLPVGRPGTTVAAAGVRQVVAVLVPLALAATALLAATGAGGPDPRWSGAGAVLAVVTAVVGGGPVTSWLLARVPDGPLAPDPNAPDPNAPAPSAPGPTPPDPAAPSPAEVLRGGATIGVLERTAIAASVLVGWPEGIAVVLAVKGLGRYPELRSPGTSERFIIGTFGSVLWALACVGVVVLGR